MRVLPTTPVTVPDDFFGMSTEHIADVAVFDAGLIRSWGYIGDGAGGSGLPHVMVRNIATSSGVYDWTLFDRLFSNAPNGRVLFTLGIPADWMITRAAIGGATYGGKSNMVPTGATELSAYTTAVAAMVTRARDVHGQTGVQWELWNEFNDTALMGESQTAFAAHAKTTYQAIKAIDPTAIVLSPSINQPSWWATLQAFFTASDGAGGYGSDWCDGASFHFYDIYSTDSAIDYWTMLQNMQRAMGTTQKPIYCTESGFWSPQFESLHLKRRILAMAALGVRHFVGYAQDATWGPMSVFADEYNEMVALLTGATITEFAAWPDGSVSAIVNGASVRF